MTQLDPKLLNVPTFMRKQRVRVTHRAVIATALDRKQAKHARKRSVSRPVRHTVTSPQVHIRTVILKRTSAPMSAPKRTRPTRTVRLVKPTRPSRPARPVKPARPAKPVRPAKPTRPMKPARPHKPVRTPKPVRQPVRRTPAKPVKFPKVRPEVRPRVRPEVAPLSPTKNMPSIQGKAKQPKPIGEVTHFFDKISVAVLKLKNTLAVGDTITISGAHTALTQKIDSMEINRERVEQAGTGDDVGLKTKKPVRVGDQVFMA